MMQKQIQLEIFDLGHRTKRNPPVDKETAEKSSEPKFPTQLCVKIASFLIITIISFALGIEHGKSISRNNNSVNFVTEKRITQIPKQITLEKRIQIPAAVVNDGLNKEELKQNSISSDEYIIQVATYKKNSSYIKKEASKLKQKGYIPFLIPSDNYMQLCAGKFSNKKIATKHLKKLEQTYKDCFIRKI